MYSYSLDFSLVIILLIFKRPYSVWQMNVFGIICLIDVWYFTLLSLQKHTAVSKVFLRIPNHYFSKMEKISLLEVSLVILNNTKEVIKHQVKRTCIYALETSRTLSKQGKWAIRWKFLHPASSPCQPCSGSCRLFLSVALLTVLILTPYANAKRTHL